MRRRFARRNPNPAGQAAPGSGVMPPGSHLEAFPMFELIVLGLILAGLAAIARAPVPKQPTDISNRPAPNLWSTRTDWHRFHKPTYLRRGVVLDTGEASSTRIRDHASPSGQKTRRTVTGEAP
jgi:hypothetical protein